MCGIAGIVDTDPRAVIDVGKLQRMCRTMVHRGPDDEGIYVKGGAGLGMRRLSIIDLAGGRQPLHNEDKSIWVALNGEIYNFQELRKELECQGHQFQSRSDTEVIVHLYEDLGAACVQKLRGMFAIALYDEPRQKLLLARDPLGIKPLHYAVVNGRLLFGSEIKAILAAAPELSEISRDGLLYYFYFRQIPDPYTAFRKIRKLPPGHLLEFSADGLSVRQYWELPAYGTHEPGSEQECLEEMEWRLAEAVRMELVADVPLGALLSGGTDSSTVVALMTRASSRPVKTFTIGFRNQDFNEAPYARAVARRFGTDHQELFVEPNIREDLQRLTQMLEEPFGDSSILPTYYVSRLARQHVTVALSGEGGDELFAGYERCFLNSSRRIFDALPTRIGQWYRKSLYHRLPAGWYGRNFLFNISLSPRERYLDYISVLPVRERQRSLFSDDFLGWTEDCPSPLDQVRTYYDDAPASDPLSRLLYFETKTSLPGDMLTKVDRMSMAASLEVRVPLLDHRFVEWVTGLPAHWKARNGRGKYVLAKLAERIGVPREVLHRPKQGFALPLVHWMRRELRDELPLVLLEPRSVQRGYFRPPVLRQMLDEHFRGRRDHSNRIWLLLMLELWHRNFLEGAARCEAGLEPARMSREELLKVGKAEQHRALGRV